MNAHTAPLSAGQVLNDALQGRDHSAERAIRDQIAAIVARHSNPDTHTTNLAVQAAREGRAAYFKTATYSQSTPCLVCNDANRTSLMEAVTEWTDYSHPGKTPSALLMWIVPLNVKAEIELRDAKHHFAFNDWEGV